MYLAIATRPDITLAVQKLSQFMNYYRSIHWNTAKRVVWYLKGRRNLQLRLGGTSPTKLVASLMPATPAVPTPENLLALIVFHSAPV